MKVANTWALRKRSQRTSAKIWIWTHRPVLIHMQKHTMWTALHEAGDILLQNFHCCLEAWNGIWWIPSINAFPFRNLRPQAIPNVACPQGFPQLWVIFARFVELGYTDLAAVVCCKGHRQVMSEFQSLLSMMPSSLDLRMPTNTDADFRMGGGSDVCNCWLLLIHGHVS